MKIYLRADGDSTIGLGHLYRMSALCECLSQGETPVSFVSRSLWRPVYCQAEAWRPLDCALDPNSETDALVCLSGVGDLFVLDGYGYRESYQNLLMGQGRLVMSVDDFRHCRYESDYVLSHSGGVTPLHFSSAPHTVFFLGPQYALVRPLFAVSQAQTPGERRLLVCLGGADPQNHTGQVLQRLASHSFESVEVVLGSANPHLASLGHQLLAQTQVQIHQDLTPEQLVKLFHRCSHAILSPSTVAYEFLSSGGGVLGLLQTADNQRDIQSFLVSCGAACPWEQMANLDPAAVATMRAAQRTLLDGRSPERLRRIFEVIRQVQAMPLVSHTTPPAVFLSLNSTATATAGWSLGDRFWLAFRATPREQRLWLRHSWETPEQVAVALGRVLKEMGLGRRANLVVQVHRDDRRAQSGLQLLRFDSLGDADFEQQQHCQLRMEPAC